MGFNNSDLRFLLSAKALGLQGNAICTLGRLNLFISQRELTKTLVQFGQVPIVLPIKPVLFADDLLGPLGFEVDSMDASEYEAATVIHDLNVPIPEMLIEKYDVAIDGGTLEHIFNFPIALENLMRLTKVGGHIMLRTPANNQCGHGFYQFSPELFFRVMVPENGFELVRIYITNGRDHFHVADPAVIHGRVELLNSEPALLMVHARKIASVPAILKTPQQSDYLEAWSVPKPEDGKLKAALRKCLAPSSIANISKILNGLRQRRVIWKWKSSSKLSNPRIYRPVREWSSSSRDAFKS